MATTSPPHLLYTSNSAYDVSALALCRLVAAALGPPPPAYQASSTQTLYISSSSSSVDSNNSISFLGNSIALALAPPPPTSPRCRPSMHHPFRDLGSRSSYSERCDRVRDLRQDSRTNMFRISCDSFEFLSPSGGRNR